MKVWRLNYMHQCRTTHLPASTLMVDWHPWALLSKLMNCAVLWFMDPAPLCTNMHLCTTMHHSLQHRAAQRTFCTTVHHHAPSAPPCTCTTLTHSAPPCTLSTLTHSLHHLASPCIALPHLTPCFITPHYPVVSINARYYRFNSIAWARTAKCFADLFTLRFAGLNHWRQSNSQKQGLNFHRWRWQCKCFIQLVYILSCKHFHKETPIQKDVKLWNNEKSQFVYELDAKQS